MAEVSVTAMTTVQLLVLCVCLVSQTSGYSSGPPELACISMVPSGHGTSGQSAPFPYTITPSVDQYAEGGSVTLTIKGKNGERFKGFLVQARRADPSLNVEEPIGRFDTISGSKILCDKALGNAISHSSSSDKSEVVLTWNAPTSFQGHVVFKATIVQTKTVYWDNEISNLVRDPTAPDIVTTTMGTGPPIVISIPAVKLDGCGSSKGCYRVPAGCVQGQCIYALSWQKDGEDRIKFEMIGKMEGDQKYMAVGFSNDKQMGDDSVIACIYDEDKGTTAVHQYYNSEDPLTSGQIGSSGLVKEGATYANSTIWCRFTRTITSSDAKMMKPLNNEYHILFAKGPVASGAVGKHGFDYYGGPAVSPQRTNLIKNDNIGGRASYPLVKAHGILMILAWVLTSSIAIIFARYFKPMWPNDRLCGERVWFANHRTLQINTLILTIIAFILIFIEVMGYSNMDSPGFAVAHPIIGIIVTILCVLNPIMALFRCHPEDDYRPIFNWFHWIVGTVAHILATINIFFGMNLAKSGVPWWVTWVMLIWVLIQFITEITLEIHQCCVHKRNKDKREQWEMQKRTDPRAEKVPEPEPSGRRFKSTMLAIYITLTVILVIIMVIAIAVS